MRRPMRRGQAPFEIALVLPLVVLLIAFLFVITSAAVTKMTALEKARVTFSERHEQEYVQASIATMTDPPEALQRMKEPLKETYDFPDELITKEATESVAPVFRVFNGWLSDAEAGSANYAGTWDFRTLKHEDESDHQQLHLVKSLKFFLDEGDIRESEYDQFGAIFGRVNRAAGGGSMSPAEFKALYHGVDHMIERTEQSLTVQLQSTDSEDHDAINRLLEQLETIRDVQSERLDNTPDYSEKDHGG